MIDRYVDYAYNLKQPIPVCRRGLCSVIAEAFFMHSIIRTKFAPKSTIPYRGIFCTTCKNTSYDERDIDTGLCRWCKVTLQPLPEKPKAEYKPCWTASKKAKKAHWTVNDTNTLCLGNVGSVIKGSVDDLPMCVNCELLKKRGFVR